MAGLAIVLSAAFGAAFFALKQRDQASLARISSLDVLRTFIPPKIRAGCRPGPTHDAVAASMRCELEAQRVTVTYDLYSSDSALQRRVRARASTLPVGSCWRDRNAFGHYSLGTEAFAGYLSCFDVKGGQAREWTVPKEHIVVSAIQRHGARRSLNVVWLDLFPSPEFNRQPFPDTDEAWLVSHVPPSFRASCERNDFTLQGYTVVATISCRPASRAATVVYYSRFRTDAELRRFYESEAAASSRRAGCADSPYSFGSKRDVGRYFCYVRRGKAWVEWYNKRVGIYGWARGPDGDTRSLLRFWGDAGPET